MNALKERRVLLSFPLLAGLVTLGIGLNTQSVLKDPDTYWHVAVGRWILQHRTIPTSDPFSHSMPGIAWTAHEWGSELVMSTAFDVGGIQGLKVIAAVAFALTIAYIMRFLLERMEPVHAVMLTLVCGAMMFTHFLSRPHVLVWPITALWVGTLVRAVEARRAPPWWLLTLVVVWANTHASFTLAVGFACALALDAVLQFDTMPERIAAARHWAMFIVAAFALVLVNPQGFGAIEYAVTVMRMTTTLAMIQEWQSASFHHFQPILLWIMLVFSLALTGRLRLSPPRLLFVAGLFYLALKHQRYHALLGVVSPMLLASPIAAGMRARAIDGESADTLDRWFRALAQPARAAGVALALLLGVGIAMASERLTPPLFNPAATPTKAVAAFHATGVQGKVLNSYVFGGYLIFSGIPVFIDGRSDMYGDPLMRETAAALGLEQSGSLEALLAKYSIGWTLLDPSTAAVRLLDRLPEWQRVYGDSIAVVHVRRTLVPHTTVAAGVAP